MGELALPEEMTADERLARTKAPRRAADWNVVITLPENTFREACRLLGKWGVVRRTRYYNVLAMTVPDPLKFLVEFEAALRESPGILNIVSHVVPAEATVDFAGAEEFEARARGIVLGWLGRLGGKSFYVRLHRRGFRGVLSTPHEERFLDDALTTALSAAGTPGRIRFDDPDVVVQIETIDTRAGLSLWTHEELRRCPFLGAP